MSEEPICPIQMLQQAYQANRSLIRTCEELITKLESSQADYGQALQYATTLADHIKKLKRKATEAEEQKEKLIKGLEMAIAVINRREGIRHPIATQLQALINECI